jgi:hypothetical protein
MTHDRTRSRSAGVTNFLPKNKAGFGSHSKSNTKMNIIKRAKRRIFI